MTAAPKIESQGAPPDRHAERKVREITLWLHARRQLSLERTIAEIDVRQMGTVAGQRRVCERVRKAGGEVLLDIRLCSGKRGKFILFLTDWSLWDPAANHLVEEGRPMPETVWLAAVFNVVTGVHHRFAARTHVSLLLTHHACVRLTQRSGVRNFHGLLIALRDLWLAVSAVVEFRPGVWTNLPTGELRVPIGDAIAVLERDKSSEERLVVKTILEAT